jgi:shikimate kinase
MGTGKTTVGKKLAETLGYGYFDTDQLIEQITKQKVHEIFEEDGEEGFRETESAILAEVASYKRVVVSTGGGIVTVRNNWMHLHNGVTVCLQGDHRTLARRVHKDGVGARPLLKECLSEEDEEAQITKIEEKIQSLWRDRGKMYAECDIAVSVNGEEDEAYGASVETIVERICKSIDKRLREDGKQEKLRKGPEVGDIEVKDLKTGERIDKVD